MARKQVSRKARFKAALALEGKTLAGWAKEHDVTVQHLNATLNNDRESKRLTGLVDEYIVDVMRRNAGALAA